MPTITLTLTDDQLERLRAGDSTLTLTATVRERKPKAAPLPDHLKDAYHAVVELWHRSQPQVTPSLAWKTMKPLVEYHGVSVLDAMALALDFNEGRAYPPTWFAKDVAFWQGLTERDLFAQEEARALYRRSNGLR